MYGLSRLGIGSDWAMSCHIPRDPEGLEMTHDGLPSQVWGNVPAFGPRSSISHLFARPTAVIYGAVHSTGPSSRTISVEVAFATSLPFSETTSASPIMTFLPGWTILPVEISLSIPGWRRKFIFNSTVMA